MVATAREVAGLEELVELYTGVVRERPGRPWLMSNMVGGLDGSAAVGGRVGSLSTGPDAAYFRALRVIPDVVLVGAETVRRERYGPVRLPPEQQEERLRRGQRALPPIAVVSRRLDLDWTSKFFTDADPEARAIVVTGARADPEQLARAREVADVLVAGEEYADPALTLDALAGAGHRVVLCEGGPTLLGELAAASLVDEVCLTVSPLMGGDPLPVAVSPAGAPVTHFALAHVAALGDTVFLRYESAGGAG